MNDPLFSDNVRVKAGRDYAEFLAVCLRQADEDQPYTVSLTRYMCPGRCDSYRFALTDQCHILYSGESPEPLGKALGMLEKDLDLPQSIALLVEAVKAPRCYGAARDLVEFLLPILAPKSKALRECRAAFKKVQLERAKRIAANREQRLKEARELVAQEGAA